MSTQFLMALFDSLLKPALDSATALIGQFHLSPEDKAKADETMRQIALQAQESAQQQDVALNQIAGANIQADKSNARPMFLYIIESVLAWNYIGVPLAQIAGAHIQQTVLPADLLTLFGVCITGYVFSRTGASVAQLPGESNVSFLGLKIANKS